MVGAEQLLTGSFQVVGNSIRVDARILEIETGKVYKTAGASGSLDNIFDLQDRLTASLLVALGLPVSDEEKTAIASKPTTSPEAFQLYSQAADVYSSDGRALSDEERIGFLEQSTRLDPNFAMAYLLLGDIYARNRMTYAQAASSYQTVTTLQPNNQIARGRLVQVYQRQGNHAAARNEAVRLDQIRRTYFHRIAPYQAARIRAIQERRIQLHGPAPGRGWDQRRVGPGSAPGRPTFRGSPGSAGFRGRQATLLQLWCPPAARRFPRRGPRLQTLGQPVPVRRLRVGLPQKVHRADPVSPVAAGPNVEPRLSLTFRLGVVRDERGEGA